MRRWAIDESDQGPVYLGYRLGHIRNDGRVFRALVYNKGAAVLHMLRRLVGDEAFFRGMRRFYVDVAVHARPAPRTSGRRWKRKRAGRSSGSSSAGSTARRCRASKFQLSRRAGRRPVRQLVLRFEQTGEHLRPAGDGHAAVRRRHAGDVVVPVTDRVVELRVPLDGRASRGVEISRDDGTLGGRSRQNDLAAPQPPNLVNLTDMIVSLWKPSR